MSGQLGDEPHGATPLDADDLAGLIPTFVATRTDLNLLEQANIEKAVRGQFRSRAPVPPENVLAIQFSDRLHRQMFGDVWRWAGTHRRRETNIGIDPVEIVTEMKKLFDDASYWHAHETYEVRERAVRLHHRLVWIHPYPNGNGRHTRLLADVYLRSSGRNRLTWGRGGDLLNDTDVRRRYLAALRAADAGDLGELVEFAQS